MTTGLCDVLGLESIDSNSEGPRRFPTWLYIHIPGFMLDRSFRKEVVQGVQLELAHTPDLVYSVWDSLGTC